MYYKKYKSDNNDFLFQLENIGPSLPPLPPIPPVLTYEHINSSAIKIRLGVPRVLDGRTGFFRVYHSSGLE